MDLNIHYLAEMLSLVMTIPTVILAFAVIYLWMPAACVAAKDKDRSANQWFILGVVGGFIGAAMDNLYWFLPWSASFVGESEAFENLTLIGVYFNVIFRQGLGIFSAWCHIKAAEMSSVKGIIFVNKLIVSSYLIGILYVTLISIKSV